MNRKHKEARSSEHLVKKNLVKTPHAAKKP